MGWVGGFQNAVELYMNGSPDDIPEVRPAASTAPPENLGSGKESLGRRARHTSCFEVDEDATAIAIRAWTR